MKKQYSHDVFISFKFENQQIVDMIVNQLTNKYNISCWICTEKIRAGENFRDDIADAIDVAKIVVLVQSKLSATSREVRQEIVEAVDAGKIIMPFIIEESQLSPSLQNLLKDIHYIDATKPTLDERIYDLAKDICQTLGKPLDGDTSDGIPELLSTPNVMPKTVFCGRDDVLKAVDERFQVGERVLFLQGVGGIGKTQIAKQYAKQYRKNYDTVVYATYKGSIREMVLAETPFSFAPEMIRYMLSDGSQESDEAFFARKLAQIKKYSDKRTLIILDNFDVERDEDLPQMMEGKYHLLITTRCDYSRYYPTIKIEPIDSLDALKDIFMKNYDGFDVEWEDPSLVELIELVNRHTYTIELLAQHMERSGQTADEMIAALKEQGIRSLGETIENADQTAQAAYENLLKMFEIFTLSEDEQRVLMYLSLMPLDGVHERDFRTWAGLTSASLIRNLERRSWIIRNTEGIALHPIIREVVRYKLPATEDNCLLFIQNFTESIEEKVAWQLKKSEKDRLASVGKSILTTFVTITEKTENLYYNVENLSAFAVDPKYSENLVDRLFDFYHRTLGARAFKTGRAAFKYGWLYTFNSHLPNANQKALTWLMRADELLSNTDLHTSIERSPLSQTKVNLAKLHLASYKQNKQEMDYAKAKEYAEQAVTLTETYFLPGDFQYAKVAGAHWQLADVLLLGGELDQALDHINISLDILIPLYSENNADSTHAMTRKAAILYAMGQYEKAKMLIGKGTLGYIEFFGESHPLVRGMYELWGDCCVALNEFDEARQVYEKALEIAQKLYTPEAMQIKEMHDKIAAISHKN